MPNRLTSTCLSSTTPPSTNRSSNKIASGRTPEEVRDELIRRDVAYVFVDWRQIARYRSPNNYGFTDFVQPEVLDTLVANGVLRPMPSPPESVYHAGKLYSVVQEGR